MNNQDTSELTSGLPGTKFDIPISKGELSLFMKRSDRKGFLVVFYAWLSIFATFALAVRISCLACFSFGDILVGR